MEKSHRRLRRFSWIAVSCIFLFVLIRLYFNLTDDFRLSNIVYDMPYKQEWEIPPLASNEQAQIVTILNQKFTYLGKGAQSYAFTSEDQKYVLKFFKFKHLKPSLFIRLLPNISPFSGIKQQESSRKQRKLNSIFSGYRLAYDKDKEESGLLYIQLNPSHRPLSVILVDKIGIERTVDLGEVVYVLQKKGKTFRVVLAELLDQGDVEAAKLRIAQIFNLYLTEYRKGIFDHDHGVMQNTGFIGDNPIHLDVGKLKDDERMKQVSVYREDLNKVAAKIERWLQNHYPQYAAELKMEIDRRVLSV